MFRSFRDPYNQSGLDRKFSLSIYPHYPLAAQRIQDIILGFMNVLWNVYPGRDINQHTCQAQLVFFLRNHWFDSDTRDKLMGLPGNTV
jgi:hypothetical protein